MGIFVGLVSAACFGLNMVLIRIGMRSSPRDDGHFMSVLTNVALLGITIIFVGFGDAEFEGIVAFVVAGLLTTFLGRGLTLRAIRLLGPSRPGIFLMASPLVVAILGVLFLEDTVTLFEGLGGLVVLGGVAVLISSKGQTEPLIEVTDEASASARSITARRKGYLFSFLAVFAFGVGFAASKWGVGYFPSPVSGAFLGSIAALAAIAMTNTATGQISTLVDNNLRRFPVWFVAGGTLTAVGLLTRYWAFLTLPAWIVSVLNGTQALWTVFWSYLLLRRDEVLTYHVVIAVGMVSAGVVILALQ